jgi:hypothetical protein
LSYRERLILGPSHFVGVNVQLFHRGCHQPALLGSPVLVGNVLQEIVLDEGIACQRYPLVLLLPVIPLPHVLRHATQHPAAVFTPRRAVNCVRAVCPVTQT